MFISRAFCHFPSILQCIWKTSVRNDCVCLEESAVFKTWIRFKIPTAFFSFFFFSSNQHISKLKFMLPTTLCVNRNYCHKIFLASDSNLSHFLLWIWDLQGIAMCWVFVLWRGMLWIYDFREPKETCEGNPKSSGENSPKPQTNIFKCEWHSATLAFLLKYVIAIDS